MKYDTVVLAFPNFLAIDLLFLFLKVFNASVVYIRCKYCFVNEVLQFMNSISYHIFKQYTHDLNL